MNANRFESLCTTLLWLLWSGLMYSGVAALMVLAYRAQFPSS